MFVKAGASIQNQLILMGEEGYNRLQMPVALDLYPGKLTKHSQPSLLLSGVGIKVKKIPTPIPIDNYVPCIMHLHARTV